MKQTDTIKRLTITALLVALVVVTGYIPPLPLAVGRVYWCDSMIFMAALLVDPLCAFVVGGLGTFLYDILIGNTIMAFVSLVIHGLQAFCVSFSLRCFPKKKEFLWAILACIIGAVVMIGGYFLWRCALAPVITPAEKSGLTYAVSKLPANLVQEAVGVAVAILIVYAMQLKKGLIQSHLLPNKSEKSKKEKPTQETN